MNSGRFGLAALAVLFGVSLVVTESHAQSCDCQNPDPPPFVHTALDASLFDLGSRFLHRLQDENAPDAGGSAASADGGGAASDSFTQRWRTWAEGYGVRSRLRNDGPVPGDTRRSGGGVAGIGFMPFPGVTLGVAVDQSHTTVDIDGGFQRGAVDLTQIGANATFDYGPWSLGFSVIHGFADVDSSRATFPPGTLARASYNAGLWGAIAELSYYVQRGTWRVVPKLGIDWQRTQIDPFAELGGIDPVTALGQTTQRTRIFAGFEVGNTWFLDRVTTYDLSAYVRLVDAISQDIGALQFTTPLAPSVPFAIQGILEDRFGVDIGAAASVRLANAMRLYALYDGRFRDNFQSQGGTLGLEVKW
jgi:uncharacterized protein with beta-barrel porin domain